MTLEEILLVIKDLSVPEALTYLVSQGIFDLSKAGFESIRHAIQKKMSEKKYGFVPDKNETDLLQKMAEKSYFLEFGYLLPKHPYSDLIRVGYLIAHMNRTGGEQNRTRVQEIRELIALRPNGAFQLKIVHMVTTGAIVSVVDYLSELKKKKYDTNYISWSFNELLIDWSKYTYFVKAEYSVPNIKETILSRLRMKNKVLMVFSYGFAKENTTKAVAEILKEPEFQHTYFYESKNNIEGDKEVHTSVFALIE